MKKSIIFAAAMAVMPIVMAATSVNIHVQPGPYGGYRVMTTWGDYMVVQNGESVWVGTEKEFEDARATAIFAQNGSRPFKMNTGATAFVPKGLPSAVVGKIELANISTVILFGVKPDSKLHRPALPPGKEYVSLSWLPSAKFRPEVRMYDEDSQTAFSPIHCGSDAEFQSCEFGIERSALGHRSAIIFTVPGAKPGVVPLKSIAAAHYAGLKEKYRPFGNARFEITKEDRDDMRKLSEIDTNIPAEMPDAH